MPIGLMALVLRLRRLLLLLEWTIFCYVALSATKETLAISAVLFLVIFSVRSIHLSEYWWIYVHWDYLIIAMVVLLMSTIGVLLVLPLVMMLMRIKHCFSECIVLDFITCGSLPFIHCLWDCRKVKECT